MREKIVYSFLAGSILLAFPVCAQGTSPTDEIVVKGTNVVIFQMTANLKLTQAQIDAVRPIIADNIAKVRNLQKKLEHGLIDSKTMYRQREQLTNDEYRQLGAILSPDQMKVWISIQQNQ